MAFTMIGLAALFFVGHALNWVFIKTKIPDLLILVFLGYLLGPILGLLSPSDFGKMGTVVSTTALIVILYEGGLHLSTKDLRHSSLPALLLTLVGFTLIGAVTAFVAYTFALQPWSTALLLAIGIGSTSSAIVIPMVKPLSIKPETKTILSLESAFTDVLTIIVFLGILDAVAAGQFDTRSFLVGLGSKPIISAGIGILSGLIWSFLKKRFAPIFKMAFANEAWALLTYGLLEVSQMNGAIGVLSLGFSLANIELLPKFLKRQINAVPVSFSDLSLLSEVTYLLKTFFFIYLGVLIQLNDTTTVLLALLIVALIFVTRYVAVQLLFSKRSFKRLDAMTTAAMGPRGLACAVLATLPLQRGIEGGEWIQNMIFAIIPLSILFTALFVSLSENEKIREAAGRLFSRYPNEKPINSSMDT